MTTLAFAGIPISDLEIAVSEVIRHASITAIMPRFRELAADTIQEKSPGEVVTIVDHEAEELLSEGLSRILPAARVIGEEACSANPGLLRGIDQGLIWIVDPLDGTANFAAGHEPFGVIVALASEGITQAAWLYSPVHHRMHFASLGGGATVREADGSVRPLEVSEFLDRPIATLATQFMSEDLRNSVIESGQRQFELQPIPRCAAAHYPRLVEGSYHIALFQRTLPWDHAAGALLLTEAGGHIARWNGSPYRFHDEGLGLLATTSRPLWDRAACALLADGRLGAEGCDILPQSLDKPLR